MARTMLLVAVFVVALLPVAMSFAPISVIMRGSSSGVSSLQKTASSHCLLRPTTRGAVFSLRMSSDVPEAAESVAGISEESDSEQRSLQKTRTNKRSRTADKDKKPLSDYTVGEMVSGKVVSIMPYGAFVDVGTTTDGLVHVSQIADDFVNDVDSVVKVGEEVSVRIISIDVANNKISLSMRSEKAAKAGGGQRGGGGGSGGGGGGGRGDVPEAFRKSDPKVFVDGKVASVMDYGVFVTLAEGVDALVHVSQISEERNVDPSKMFKVGQDVKVRIMQYDSQRRRLSLSMKEWTEAPEKDESDDIKGYVDPVPENTKTAFQMAWEAAQKEKSAA